MKKLVLGKTLFEAYKYLGRIIKSVDRLVVETSASSHSNNIYLDNTLDNMEAVIDLIQRKKRLVALKMIIEEGLKSMESYGAKILVRYYIDKVDTATIAEENKTNSRTIRRHINSALVDCIEKIYELGYDNKFLESIISNEGWIVGIYNSNVVKMQNKDSSLNLFSLPQMSRLDRLINSVYGRV